MPSAIWSEFFSTKTAFEFYPYLVAMAGGPVYKFFLELRKEHRDLTWKTIIFCSPTMLYLGGHGVVGIASFHYMNVLMHPQGGILFFAGACGLGGSKGMSKVCDSLVGSLGTTVNKETDQMSEAGQKAFQILLEIRSALKKRLSARLALHRNNLVKELSAGFPDIQSMKTMCHDTIHSKRRTMLHSDQNRIKDAMQAVLDSAGDRKRKGELLGDLFLEFFGEKEVCQKIKEAHREASRRGR